MSTPSLKPIITVDRLSVTYLVGHRHEVRALQEVSLSIYPGEFIIFFGPSGCGKSTLLYSIAGLETRARGTVLVGGENVATMAKDTVARYRQKRIGMIFQAFYLVSTLSVLKNVLVPQMAIGIAPAERTKRALELLKHFGVETQAGKLPTELSGGQQQRVAISRALVNDPDIILADEPVGNLDSKSAMDVIKLIQELNEQQHKTVILVTHDPSHLHIAHRVFYMRDGMVIDTKVNRAITPAVLTERAVHRPTTSKALEMLLKTFAHLGEAEHDAKLIPYKAKEIVTEALTGLTVEEQERIERRVQHLLAQAITGDGQLARFLDLPAEQGGLGLDRRTAQKIADRVQTLVDEIHLAEREEERHAVPEEIRTIRIHLLEAFDIDLVDTHALASFDATIGKRLADTIDERQVVDRFDLPVANRGAGLNRQTARKAAKRLEFIKLGTYAV